MKKRPNRGLQGAVPWTFCVLSGEACISRVPRGVSAAQSRCLRIGHPRSAPISSGTSAPRSLEAGISKAKRRFSKRRTEISKRPKKFSKRRTRFSKRKQGRLVRYIAQLPRQNEFTKPHRKFTNSKIGFQGHSVDKPGRRIVQTIGWVQAPRRPAPRH